ncbi:MAG TPA: serine hydrolase domain-containing protein [Gammaproteobacteria bacterium]|nr:serine hydrolase domain-containing protein [Gammaproteobacteria bacterium]
MIDTSSIQSTRERIQAFLERVQSQTKIPGIALALSVNGQRLYASAGAHSSGNAAPITERDRFHLGCTSKLLLAVAALELARQGRLVLQAPLAEYLPELEGTQHGESVQVRHLLSHTSGYRGTNIFDAATRELSWSGLTDYLRRTPRLFRPGEVFSYEHTESVLLGRIVERAAGRKSLELIRESILSPLGIEPGRLEEAREDPLYAGQNHFDARARRFTALGEAPKLPNLWHAAFSNYTVSVSDLLAIGEAVLGSSRVAGGQGLVSEDTLRALLRPVVELPTPLGGAISELLPVAFGLGAAKLPGGAYGHNGQSFGQSLGLRVDPHRGLALTLGMNATLPHLRDFIMAAVLSDSALPLSPSSAVAGRSAKRIDWDLSALAGSYLGPGAATLEARMLEGSVMLEIREPSRESVLIGALAEDGQGGAILQAQIPQLSVAFFREPSGEGLGLMLGLNAYKRISPASRSA